MNQVSGGKPRVLFGLHFRKFHLCQPSWSVWTRFERQCLDGWRLWGGSAVCTRVPRRLCFLWESNEVRGLLWWFSGEEPTCQCRRLRFHPWVRKIPWKGHGNPLRCSYLVNPLDRAAWWAAVPGSQGVTPDWVANDEVLLCSTFLEWDGTGTSMDSTWLSCHQGPFPCSVREPSLQLMLPFASV